MSEFNAVLEESELQERAIHTVAVDGVPVLVSRSKGGEACTIANTCTHRGGPLNGGERDRNVVTCPWHGSQFDLCSGEVLRGWLESPSSASRMPSRREGREVRSP
jgi:nitrite reductase/ring-hydroxylating ferredoxin subunit